MKIKNMVVAVLLSLPMMVQGAGEPSPLQPPRSIDEVLGADFVKEKFNLEVPSREVKLPYGYKVHTVKVPWAVRGQLIQMVATADLAPVQELVGTRGLKAVSMNGQAVLMFYFLDYVDSGAGPYEEFVMGYLAHKTEDAIPEFRSMDDVLKGQETYGDKIINFVQHLTLGGPDENFLNFQHAIWAGRVAISYPKYYGRSLLYDRAWSTLATASITQPGLQPGEAEVPYFSMGQPDSDKAGSMRLDVRINKTDKTSPYAERVYTDFHAAPTLNGQLCVMGNYIYVEAKPMNLRATDISFEVSGTSSTAQFLGRINVVPVKAFHARSLKTFMAPKESADNDCRGASGLPYNHLNFYPSELLPKE